MFCCINSAVILCQTIVLDSWGNQLQIILQLIQGNVQLAVLWERGHPVLLKVKLSFCGLKGNLGHADSQTRRNNAALSSVCSPPRVFWNLQVICEKSPDTAELCFRTVCERNKNWLKPSSLLTFNRIWPLRLGPWPSSSAVSSSCWTLSLLFCRLNTYVLNRQISVHSLHKCDVTPSFST